LKGLSRNFAKAIICQYKNGLRTGKEDFFQMMIFRINIKAIAANRKFG